jgi:hypothetical protein
MDSISLADTRTWSQRQQGLQTIEEQDERDVFLEHNSEDEDKDEVVGLQKHKQLSSDNISNGVMDIQDEDHEFPSDQEINGGVNGGASRSDRAVPSSTTLIILVNFLSLPLL